MEPTRVQEDLHPCPSVTVAQSSSASALLMCWVQAVLCTVGCAPWASTPTGCHCPLFVTTTNVSRHCQMSPRGSARTTGRRSPINAPFPAWLCCHPATRRGSGLVWWPAHCPHTPAEACVTVCVWALSVAGSLAWRSGGLAGKSWLSCSLLGDPQPVPLYCPETRFFHL